MKTNTLKTLFGAMIIASMINVSCTHSSPAPAAPPSTTPSTTTVSLSPAETILIGDWCYDKAEAYLNGIVPTGGTTYYHDSTVYHIRFNSASKASPLDPTAPVGTYKECIDGTSGMDNPNYWQITTSGKLNIGGATYSVFSSTPTILIYYTGSLITGSAIKYYFHKL
jgi:hypothetical protein